MLGLQSVDLIRGNLGIRIPISEKTLQKLIDKHLPERLLRDIIITYESEFICLKGKYKGINILVELIPLRADNGNLFLMIKRVKPINWCWVLGKFIKRYSPLMLQGRILSVNLHGIKALKGFPVGLCNKFEINKNKLWIGI